MVLCPFVYLQLRYDLPPLALQPTEVHSAHWVKLNRLLAPSLITEVRCDVSDRFRRRRTAFLKWTLRAIVGQLVFGAVKLKPTESLYSDRVFESAPKASSLNSIRNKISYLSDSNQADPDEQQLLLWGLTLGILADLLELIDRTATARLWSWPTFSPWDLRILIWLLNRKFQSRKIRELTIVRPPQDHQTSEICIDGLDNTSYSRSIRHTMKGSEAGIAGMMLLAGYTNRLRGAVIVGLLMRVTFGAIVLFYGLHKYHGYLSRSFSA